MIALKLIITGLVQGVGFRPFIHRIAYYNGLKGYVRNVGGSEVEVWIEGDHESIQNFIKMLYTLKPPTSIIDEVEIYFEKPRGYREFTILKSSRKTIKRSMIPPDFSICSDCLREVLDKSDRRYRYAFNSCAWCGPRFSMMYRVPYDRENTSMRKYSLCNDCLREYTDINNIRRYHAQGISCPRDGPRLYLATNKGDPINTKDPIIDAAKLIDEGYIVAIKGIGGYHIAATATDDDVVLKLRKRKKRPQKPFAIMALNTDVLNKLVYLDNIAKKVLESPQKPIVLLPKRENTPVSKYVSPGLDVEGVFLPYTGLHYLLLDQVKDKFLIMTSGNIHGKPMCTTEECVFKKLSSIVDYVLYHDREIVNRVDDSVVRFTGDNIVFLRRSRGYAPRWIKLPIKLVNEYIALGGEKQNCAAIGFEDKIVLTQYIGDVDDLDTLSDLKKYIDYFIGNYRISIDKSIVVVDKHPHYMSRELLNYYGRNNNVIEVQHHVAHVLGAAIDRNILEPFIGIAIDGTGYGDDGNIWGGEIIYVDMHRSSGDILHYKRIGHLEYHPLIGGDRTIYYPARFVVSVISKYFNDTELTKIINSLKLDREVPLGVRELQTILKIVRSGKTRLYTSSTGRFLDGVSTLLNVCSYRSYEGEPAIKLEAFSRKGKLLDDFYFNIRIIDGKYVIDTGLIYVELINNLSKYAREDIAYTIQYRLGEALGHVVKEYLYGLRNISQTIVLSGGAAVNSVIYKGLSNYLKEFDIKVYLPRKIPPNDGGIAFGQIVYGYFVNNLG